MSIIEKILVINPPISNIAEQFVYNGFECPSCNGNGYFISPHYRHGSIESNIINNSCSRCSGSGKLKVYVSVKWSPDEPKIE